MKNILPYFILFVLVCATPVFGQNLATLKIVKTNGLYAKTIKLPANIRIVKHNQQVEHLKLDSINNGYFYGNNGKDSILLTDIKTVNLSGLKEVLKYTAVAACAAITIGVACFTIYAFNYPVVIDGNNNQFKYVGMGYMATFGALGTTFYLFPRTKFKTCKYTFQTN
ncbi:MAG: hypothetical protein KBG11_03760 [Bacteroidia bacterium]|nr:hypothetical protein [Bacteroidia bacterium]